MYERQYVMYTLIYLMGMGSVIMVLEIDVW